MTSPVKRYTPTRVELDENAAASAQRRKVAEASHPGARLVPVFHVDLGISFLIAIPESSAWHATLEDGMSIRIGRNAPPTQVARREAEQQRAA